MNWEKTKQAVKEKVAAQRAWRALNDCTRTRRMIVEKGPRRMELPRKRVVAITFGKHGRELSCGDLKALIVSEVLQSGVDEYVVAENWDIPF